MNDGTVVQKRERIDSLDSLRGVACCVIAFLWHYLNMQPRENGMPFMTVFSPFYYYGQYLVELFFMLSGFVMAYCYRSKIEQGEAFLPYMQKRYRHLYPLFFTTLMATVALQYWHILLTGNSYVYQTSVFQLILNLFCIQTGWLDLNQSFNGPAWCISVEIFLYILYYVSTRVTRKDRSLHTVVNLTLFMGGLIFVFLTPYWKPFLNEYIMRGVACFYGGVLLCELNDYLSQEQKEQFAWKALCALVIFRVALAVSPYSFWDNQKYGQMGLILIQWPILIFAAINWKTFRRLLENRPLLYLGKISMDIYLWHIPVQITIKSIDSMLGLSIDYGSKVTWVIYVVSVLAVASVSHHLFAKETKRHYFLKAAAAMVCCAVLLFATEVTGTRMTAVMDNSLSYADKSSCRTMEPGVKCSEDFVADRSGYVQNIQFYTITWQKPFAGDQKITVRLVDQETGEALASADRWIQSLKDGQTAKISFNEKPYLERGRMYTLEFETNTTQGQETMALLFTRSSGNSQTAVVNDSAVDEHISAKVFVRK